MTLSPSQGQPITVALIAMGLQVRAGICLSYYLVSYYANVSSIISHNMFVLIFARENNKKW